MPAVPVPYAACYLRVSTDRQTVANQRADVERLATARGFAVRWFTEEESAVKVRPQFEAMRAAVRRGEVRAVVVWALDRFHRSMQATVADVLELDRLGVPLLSVREPWLDTSGPVRSLLVSIFGWIAEQERARLIERTRAGLDRARREGRTLGRPRASSTLVRVALSAYDRARELQSADPAWSAVTASRNADAKGKGVSESTLRRALRARQRARDAARAPEPDPDGPAPA